ncbi:MAG: hypothetical protein JSS60_04290 [Verrucomicrobia bacterium]|nr:hypothetical protein [Verrucomicrobiota bacterium]
MSLSAVSQQMPRPVEQNSAVDTRLMANEGESSCLSTALKAAAVVAGLIASIASFIAGGPIVGLVVSVACGAGLLMLFSSCCGGSHNHSRSPTDPVPVYIPWYQRAFSFIPTGWGSHAAANGPHVPVGRGHQAPHVPVGHGHIPDPSPRPWYDFSSYIPDGIRYMDNGGHVPVGGGHGRGGHVQVGGGHGRGGHVGVGRGHGPTGGNPHGHGPTQVPPPSGPTGHVPVGRGHRY